MTTQSTETLTFDAIAERLGELGIENTRHERGSDREMIEIPGYGQICQDESSESPGYFVREIYSIQPVDRAIEDDELLVEIEELAAQVSAERVIAQRSDLTWHTPPALQGQTVEVSYALDEPGERVLRRERDHSLPTDRRDTYSETPQNG